MIQKNIAAVYVVKPEFIPQLSQELGEVTQVIEDLLFSPIKNPKVCFALDIWLEPHIVHFESISEAVSILKRAGKFWYLHPVSHVRRGRLIEEQLRQYKDLLKAFPLEQDLPSIGAFSLLDKNTLVFSSKRLKKWPDGRCYFLEDKINPPNRAYLKLWEALTLLGNPPKKGDQALDLGASPGGWTYVMQSQGCLVTAVDKADLNSKIASLPGVTCLKQSAFAMEPDASELTYDWVLSDIACYPERAYTLVNKWIASKKAKQLIVTIKLQGDIDLKMIKQFQDIPGSAVRTLFYNKHEATFFYPAPQS